MNDNDLREKARDVAQRHFPSAPPGSPLVYQRENAAKSITQLAKEHSREEVKRFAAEVRAKRKKAPYQRNSDEIWDSVISKALENHRE